MKVTKDGFAWLLITDKAKKVYSSGLFDVYILHDDDSETLVEDMSMLDKALSIGEEIGIEAGRITSNCARTILKADGFFTENLWNVTDVVYDYECSDDEAQDVLYDVLYGDATIEYVFDMIRIVTKAKGFKKKY